ncbi:MAG: hypothetical protein EBS61_07165 [Betaproteobacteria bacterium]|nr:hypothetical protein [Betaproteobacteria bacterium]
MTFSLANSPEGQFVGRQGSVCLGRVHCLSYQLASLMSRLGSTLIGLLALVIAINDFHGNLKPPFGGLRIRNPLDPASRVQIRAGGAEHLATAVARLRTRNPHSVFVGAGDLIGATPLLSALFNDEPSIESLNLMGLSISAVGNHEFDRGLGELLRLQGGGCHPTKGCQGPKPFEGARFQYLAASTVEESTGRTILPAYAVRYFEGIPVAFIGLTLAATPSIVTPSSVHGLRFLDEACSSTRVAFQPETMTTVKE